MWILICCRTASVPEDLFLAALVGFVFWEDKIEKLQLFHFLSFSHHKTDGKRTARTFVTRLLVTMLIAASTAISAKDAGKISGRVIDAVSGQPLPGANVVLQNTLLGASADDGGRYIIPNVPVGTWEIVVSYISYSPLKTMITVEKDSVYTLDFSLKSSAILFDQVVITGSRQAEDLSKAVNSVNVLPSSEILERNYLRTDRALQQLPAVDLIGENLSIRGGSGYSFLGVGGSRVLMLIDDVPMLTSDFSRANWDFLPVTDLERAEVLKGAASVLYGSGGISSVVNLISRKPTIKPRFAFRTSAGVYDEPSVEQWKWSDSTLYFYRADLSYSQTFGPLGLRLSVSRHYDKGYRLNSDQSRWYFTARPEINFGDGSQLNLFLAYNREDRGLFFLWDGQNNALTTPFLDRAQVDGWLTSAVYKKPFSTKFMTTARFSINSQLLGLPLSITRGFEPALGIYGELRGVWQPNRQHTVTMGFDYRHDVAESGFFGKHSANSYSPYIQDNWKLTETLQISAGLRFNGYFLNGDTSETQLSPKFGVSYQPFRGTILHSSIGRGFRTPSIAERFTDSDLQDAAQLVKNPNLRSERATLFDIGLRQAIGNNISLEVAGFISNYEDLIELTQIGDLSLILQFRNCPEAIIRGVESQANIRLLDGHFNILMNGTWMESESQAADFACQLDEGEALPYRPKFSGFISPSIVIGPVVLEGEYRYISRYDRVSFFLNEERVAQKILNLRTRFHWKQFMLLFQVNNAVNHNHTVVEQNIGEIRNFSVSFSGEF